MTSSFQQAQLHGPPGAGWKDGEGVWHGVIFADLAFAGLSVKADNVTIEVICKGWLIMLVMCVPRAA